MILALIAIVIGIALLVYSADFFIDGASALAHKFGMPKFLIGMLVIGIGTSAPEIVVSVLSTINGAPGLALGNAYGSNIVNITLVLGATALISPLLIQKSLVRTDFLILLGVTALAIFQLIDGDVSRVDGVILLAVLAVFLVAQIWLAKRAKSQAQPLETDAADVPAMPMGRALIKLIGGLVVLVASSRLVVWGAVEMAQLLGLSELVIGLTIVAVGTSLPELVSSIIAARKGEDEMALGNVIGSNIFNTLAVVGVASVIAPMSVAQQVISRDMWVMAAVTALLFVLCLFALRGSQKIGRGAGGLLLTIFVGYTAWLFVGS
ncbi:calcium/sodium antiporter [Moraxella caviae]|uniref:Calcium/sodium antiporter n=1 Tax=Moraxella caviae TaxID=34060 RepID=A0A1T0A9R0_9GAMM|nr:calcium/sodium antiporter [Moraxella caviae]OOR92474.1 calcium/sodium antiporter [Moraxella caviae]STZ13839.1 Inner membrane protein yrbG [Moraxella caviae]VEW12900.1 Inner membrane protein yrbG [Moraxella caviae]VEW13145.1 Inner membrane protein yrbG [Moraxella caviae]